MEFQCADWGVLMGVSLFVIWDGAEMGRTPGASFRPEASTPCSTMFRLTHSFKYV